jgi:hypothetical protein
MFENQNIPSRLAVSVDEFLCGMQGSTGKEFRISMRKDI